MARKCVCHIGPQSRHRAFLIIVFKAPVEKEPAATEKKADESPIMQLSKEELIGRIEYLVEITPQIKDFIPELKSIDLKTLSKEDLAKLYSRVNNERARIQTERIQRQLDAVRASQNIPRPPVVHAPPPVPKAPTPPPAPPKIPPPPTPMQPGRR